MSSVTVHIPRGDVASIGFAAIDLLVKAEPVIRGARDGGEWIDITPRLKEGTTPVGLRIHNDRDACAEIVP